MAFFLTVPPPALADDADLPAAIVQRCRAATVFVDLGKEGSGSGFLVHSCGLIVTNRHVVEDIANGATVKVVLNSGQPEQKTVQARVAVVSQDEDLALLKTDEEIKAQPLPLTDSSDLVELNRAVVFGYPFGKSLASKSDTYPAISVNVGRISSLRREGGKLERIQLDAATNPGNSGGPVIDKDGKVIGIIVSGILGSGVYFAIPAAKLMPMLAQPVLSLRTSEITYAHRSDVRDFEVEVFPTAQFPPDAEITVRFGDPQGPQRSYPVTRKDGKYFVTAAPCSTLGAVGHPRLRVSATWGPMTLFANVDDCPVRVGNRALRLSELHEIEKKENAVKTTLAHFDKDREEYETVEGQVTGLPQVRSELNHLTLNLQDARNLKLGIYDPGVVRMPYQISMASKGKPVAESRGALTFADPPRGLRTEDEDQEESTMRRRIFFFRMMRGGDESDLRLDPLIDPSKDVRQGTWVRNKGVLETRPEPSAWCEIPVIPTKDYSIKMQFKPKDKSKGELLLRLPIGKSCAFLRIDGAQGSMKLNLLDAKSGDGEGSVLFSPFAKGQDYEISVDITSEGDNVFIMARFGESRPLVWEGHLKELVAPPDSPVNPERLSFGHRDLEMTVERISVSAADGALRIMREIPGSIQRNPNVLVGHWALDVSPQKRRLPSSGGGVAAELVGSPQIGIPPAIVGAGAMKLTGAAAGFQVDESDRTNRGMQVARTVSMWFMADAPDAKDHRQYLYDEGGSDRGYALYLENGTLYAGGWDEKGNWKGTWLKAREYQSGAMVSRRLNRLRTG